MNDNITVYNKLLNYINDKLYKKLISSNQLQDNKNNQICILNIVARVYQDFLIDHDLHKRSVIVDGNEIITHDTWFIFLEQLISELYNKNKEIITNFEYKYDTYIWKLQNDLKTIFDDIYSAPISIIQKFKKTCFFSSCFTLEYSNKVIYEYNKETNLNKVIKLQTEILKNCVSQL